MRSAAVACALLLGVACPSPTIDVAVAFHGKQPRRTPVMRCDVCTFYDLADPATAPTSHRVLVLDGHSNPPMTVVGRPLAEFAAVLRAVDPVALVGITCRLGELHALAQLFAAAPRLTTIVASPAPLSWGGYAAVADCLARDLDDFASCVPPELSVYRRDELTRLQEVAHAMLAEIQTCRAAPVLVARRRFPPHLCVTRPGLPPVGWRLDYGDLVQRCGDRPPRLAVDDPCTAGDPGPTDRPAAP